MPRAPRPTTLPRNSSPSARDSDTCSPEGRIRSMPSTAPAREGLPTPDPWVPVWTAPATEMWGSDAKLWMARPDCLQRAAQGAVAHSAADVDGPLFRIQFNVLRQRIQQHMHAGGVPNGVE